jgi:predicted nucleotidyltransferase
MVTIPEKIIKVVVAYVNKISTQIPIQKAILFGSYAKGSFSKDSDVDLAIFSDHFNNMSRIERNTFLLLEATDYHVDLQPQAFTSEDLENPLGIVEEILKTGIEIPVS